MQKDRGSRDLRDPFDMFGGFGNFGDFGGSIFGRNPFDDPFFTRPFGSILGDSNSLGDPVPLISSDGPIIQEINSDDDDDDEGQKMENKGEDGQKSARSGSQPFVDHPDDETDDSSNHANYRTNYNREEGAQAQTFKVHSSKVTYGGVDGVYYTSSATRRMGSDGVIMEECKEADKRTGEATHRISRGLHEKGHSIARRLNNDGKVDTSQTLHNMDEDELGSLEEAWNGNTGKHLPPWTGSSGTGMNRASDGGRLLLPSIGHLEDEDPSAGRSRKIIRIPID